MDAIDRGMQQAEVSSLFRVSVRSIKRWRQRQRQRGHLAESPRPGRTARKLAALRAGLLPQLEAHPDATLEELCQWWEETHGVRVSRATMSRVITRHFGWTRKKKSFRAKERDETKRAAWRVETRAIDPSRFVWVDETGSHRGMTRTHSRAPRGHRAHDTVPGNRGANRTLIAALTLEGPGPGLLLDEAINRVTFDGYIIHRLAPTLKPGQIVVVDNLKVHYSDRAREAIEAQGATLRYLPTYSPDFNPIEEAFSKLKAFLRSAAARTLEEHSSAIWAALRSITANDAIGWFAHAGYGPRRRRRPKRSARRRPVPIITSTRSGAPPAVARKVA